MSRTGVDHLSLRIFDSKDHPLTWEMNEYDGAFLDFVIQSRQGGLNAPLLLETMTDVSLLFGVTWVLNTDDTCTYVARGTATK